MGWPGNTSWRQGVIVAGMTHVDGQTVQATVPGKWTQPERCVHLNWGLPHRLNRHEPQARRLHYPAASKAASPMPPAIRGAVAIERFYMLPRHLDTLTPCRGREFLLAANPRYGRRKHIDSILGATIVSVTGGEAPMIGELISSFLAVVFLSSAWSKFRDPATFVMIMESYRLPRGMRISARGIPWLEALLGLALLSPNVRWTVTALGGALVFILVASGAVAIRLLRGEKRFRCGCGGDLTEEHNGVGIIVRNILLILLVILGLVGASSHWLPATPVLPIYLIGMSLALCWQLGEALLRAWRFTYEWKASG